MTGEPECGPVAEGAMTESRIALYIHIPFCRRKCYYCDFNSYPAGASAPGTVEAYTAALIREIRWYAARLALSGDRVAVGSIYIGGGTPTLLETGQLQAILAACQEGFSWDTAGGAQGTEVTVEANPGTLTPEKLEGLLAAGVNRLSLGAQSLSDNLLAAIGRIHSAGDFVASYQLARRIGFANINVDLIFGLPGQTLAEWEETLGRVVAMGPEHISAYGLIIEAGTPFAEWVATGKITPAGEELEAAMFETTMATLEAAGFEHYEISNYARPGYQCRHNLVYWHNEPYIGVGAGAWGYWRGIRYANASRPEEYLARMSGGKGVDGVSKAVVETERPSLPVQMGETMMMGLRLLKGVSFRRFRERFGRGLLEVYAKEAADLQKEGLLHISPDGVRLTRRGVLLANRVFAAFLP
ncbi:MAG: radical SAM family heme chaperone HemW [Syntrophothermus sp.]